MIMLGLYSLMAKFLYFWLVSWTMMQNESAARVVPPTVFTIACLIDLGVLFLLFRGKSYRAARVGGLLAFNLVFGIFCLGTIMFYRLFGVPLSLDVMGFGQDVTEIGDSVRSLLEPMDGTLFAFDLVSMLILVIPAWRRRFAASDEFFCTISTKRIVVAILLLAALWVPFAEPRHSFFEPFTRRDLEGVWTFNPLNYFLLEVATSLKETCFPSQPDPLVVENIRREIQARKERQSQVPKRFPERREPLNVILIQMESVMFEVLGAQLQGQSVTPNLDAMAREGVLLPSYYSPAISTADSEFSALTSLYPISNKTVYLNLAHHRFESLPKILGRSGYATFVTNGSLGRAWNVRNMHKRLGFQHQAYFDEYRSGRMTGPWLADSDLLERVSKRVMHLSQPFFAFVMLISSHHPFTLTGLPETFAVPAEASAEEKEWIRYCNAVHYTDSAIGEFLARLRQQGLLERTLVVAYGDHPIMLKRQFKTLRDLYGGLPSGEKIMRMMNSRVPGIIYAPGFLSAGTIDRVCSHVDLAPTILELCGLPPSPVFLGSSVFAEGPGSTGHKYWVAISS
ncbi:MAG TPA: LTA synthase family protein, partial [Candidatus Ozemobacteraceae bacterium]|nr:LTA synthase family protein [Candidatus Ozemobacteraceae bacterium]